MTPDPFAERVFAGTLRGAEWFVQLEPPGEEDEYGYRVPRLGPEYRTWIITMVMGFRVNSVDFDPADAPSHPRDEFQGGAHLVWGLAPVGAATVEVTLADGSLLHGRVLPLEQVPQVGVYVIDDPIEVTDAPQRMWRKFAVRSASGEVLHRAANAWLIDRQDWYLTARAVGGRPEYATDEEFYAARQRALDEFAQRAVSRHSRT